MQINKITGSYEKSVEQSNWLRQWVGTGLVLFVLASLFGAMMRYVFVWPLPAVNYKYILHAHSHLALMGWGFTILSGLLIATFIPNTGAKRGYFRVLGINILSGTGMLVFFPYQGYGPFSIAFSTLHLVAAYLFAILFLKDLKGQSSFVVRGPARWAVYWMLISSLGLWALGPLGIWLGKAHPVYLASIQFFLHFQIHGWFVYAMMALIITHWNRWGGMYQPKPYAFPLLQMSLIFTLALSLHWIHPHPAFIWINRLGVVLQAVAFWKYLSPILFKLNAFQNTARHITRSLWITGLWSLAAKAIFQLMTLLPAVAEASFTIRNFFIGFVHLIMLGAVSSSAFAIVLSLNVFKESQAGYMGYWSFLAAFWGTEILLFYQGFNLWTEQGFLPGYHGLLLAASLLFPLSLIMILLRIGRFHPWHSILRSFSPLIKQPKANHPIT